jgi:CcmD family protein
MENLSWLFYAYGVGWLVILGYLFQISLKERSLRRKIGQLAETIEQRWQNKGGR